MNARLRSASNVAGFSGFSNVSNVSNVTGVAGGVPVVLAGWRIGHDAAVLHAYDAIGMAGLIVMVGDVDDGRPALLEGIEDAEDRSA